MQLSAHCSPNISIVANDHLPALGQTGSLRAQHRNRSPLPRVRWRGKSRAPIARRMSAERRSGPDPVAEVSNMNGHADEGDVPEADDMASTGTLSSGSS